MRSSVAVCVSWEMPQVCISLPHIPDMDFTNSALMENLQRAGVRIYPVEDHTIRKGVHCDKVLLGYGNLASTQIVEGVRRLAKGLLNTLD
jgi:DNA-binding transcriptional MocR family regulator